MKAINLMTLRTAALIALMGSITVAPARDWNSANGHSNDAPHAGVGEAKASACSPATATTEMALNNVRALIQTGGLLWYDKSGSGHPAYEVPKSADRLGPKAIYAGGLWMGGLSPDNQLKLAAIRYQQGNDFWPGPLTTDGTASVTSEVCSKYDQFFPSKVKDAQRHDAYYRCLNDPSCDLNKEFPDGYAMPSYFNDWPAINQDPGYDTYLAPFTDLNQNGDYEPQLGEYPGYDLAKVVDCKNKVREDPVPLFGDENIWWVFNDKGNTHTETGGTPIGMEIRAQAFAFSTNDEVNNMTFYNYVLINRGSQTLTHTYFGQYADPDLGCSNDDFAGCDVQRGLGYVYNWDNNDEDCLGSTGYGSQPPAIGIDFFEGPFQDYDGEDNPGPLTSAPYPDCSYAVEHHGIGYRGIGIGYGDGTPDNERFGMRAYIYFNRDGPSCCNDPGLAVQYYNYLRSIWKDNTHQTYDGSGYSPNNTSAVNAFYMFPGDSDPIGWGTGCVPQAPWQETQQQNPDRRFVQSAGPFTLQPGAYNNITVGVVWARATSGGPFASVQDMRKADDKAQALFDNCFRILDGPDAPNIDLQELDRQLVLYLVNPLGSNNYKEQYQELDPTIPEQDVTSTNTVTIVADTLHPDYVPPLDTGIATTVYTTVTTILDRYYHFQGYQVFQVKDATVSVSELGDVTRARLLAVCDLPDSVGRLVNWIQNSDIGEAVPTEMVNGPDTGVFHSLSVTRDLFATGDPRLVNYKTYYYMALAYGYNRYESYSPGTHSGQAYPYKAGRKAPAGSIHSYSGIPHGPAAEANGTIQHSQYGDEFQITRIEGQGNGGLALDIDKTSEDQIISGAPWRVDQIKYKVKAGPVKVKVVDPLNVPEAEFELWFKDTTDLPIPNNPLQYTKLNDAFWMLVRLNPEGQTNKDTVRSDHSIEVGYEQLIPDWGISVSVDQTEYTGSLDYYTKPLASFFEYVGFTPQSQFWYAPIFDADGENAFNWIRAGTATDATLGYPDYKDVDPTESYERFGGGGWSPWPLVGDTAFQPGALSIHSTIVGSKLNEISSIQVVFTPDKSKWTRCPVVEETEIPSLATPVGTAKLKLKPVPSVDKNGRKSGDNGYNSDEGGLAGPTGMSWFPGYAIELETGERMNMAFGEDSFWGGSAGRDMIWDPTDQVANNQGDPLMAGSHWIYVFKNLRRIKQDVQQMPQYDQGQFLYDKLVNDQAADRTRIWKSCDWVGSASLTPGTHLLTPEEGLIPTELRIRLDVNKPYFTYEPYPGQPDPGGVNVDRNAGLPLYTFSTRGSATETNVNAVQVAGLENIGIVPNPYFAFSGYETSRLDNRVKFINLPRTCTISIYNVGGTLVRKYKKDNDLTYVDWDLKNAYNVPIAGGTYICHIEVPDAGETVLKWFGVMRPVDLQNF